MNDKLLNFAKNCIKETAEETDDMIVKYVSAAIGEYNIGVSNNLQMFIKDIFKDFNIRITKVADNIAHDFIRVSNTEITLYVVNDIYYKYLQVLIWIILNYKMLEQFENACYVDSRIYYVIDERIRLLSERILIKDIDIEIMEHYYNFNYLPEDMILERLWDYLKHINLR